MKIPKTKFENKKNYESERNKEKCFFNASKSFSSKTQI